MVEGKGADVFRRLAVASKIATRTHLLVILNFWFYVLHYKKKNAILVVIRSLFLALDLGNTSCNAGM